MLTKFVTSPLINPSFLDKSVVYLFTGKGPKLSDRTHVEP